MTDMLLHEWSGHTFLEDHRLINGASATFAIFKQQAMLEIADRIILQAFNANART